MTYILTDRYDLAKKRRVPYETTPSRDDWTLRVELALESLLLNAQVHSFAAALAASVERIAPLIDVGICQHQADETSDDWENYFEELHFTPPGLTHEHYDPNDEKCFCPDWGNRQFRCGGLRGLRRGYLAGGFGRADVYKAVALERRRPVGIELQNLIFWEYLHGLLAVPFHEGLAVERDDLRGRGPSWLVRPGNFRSPYTLSRMGRGPASSRKIREDCVESQG